MLLIFPVHKTSRQLYCKLCIVLYLYFSNLNIYVISSVIYLVILGKEPKRSDFGFYVFESYSCRGWQFCKSKENMMIKDLVDQKCNTLRNHVFHIKTIKITSNLLHDSIIQFINFRHCHPFSLFKDQLCEKCISSKLWGGMH